MTKLIRRTEIEKPEFTYNLHVNNNHNYVANGNVVSNCHGAKAKQLYDILTEYGQNIVHRYGLTGTMPKEDMTKLQVHIALGHINCEYSAASLIGKGWLSQPEVDILQLNDVKIMQENGIKNIYDLMYEEEGHYFNTSMGRIQWIADYIMSNAKKSKVGNTLVLVNTIQFGKDLHAMIPNSFVLNGSDSVKNRNKVYDLFETNDDVIAICTKQIAGVGLSVDRIFTLVFIDAGKSFINTIQGVGRGLRKGRDKDKVNILDICSNLPSANKHMIQRVKYYKEAGYPNQLHKIDYEN